MINTQDFFNSLKALHLDSFYGVPDSLLKELCACITDNCNKEKNIIAANEGNALAIATGHYLATGLPGVVYMQNSGLGNIVNPLLSLIDDEVYNIPALLIIGWRGEPGVHDEPQHVKQGKLTLPLLETMGIKYEILENIDQILNAYKYMQETKKAFAFVVRKGTFSEYKKIVKTSDYTLSREEAISNILNKLAPKDVVVSTTGMISREVYENRATHEKDFLTVGSMGHASSIAFGVAISKPDRKIFCLDGDGAFIMHMGALGVIASRNIGNLKHIVLNNEAHDSVGSQPTVANTMDFCSISKDAGYKNAYRVSSIEELNEVWPNFYASNDSALLEIKVHCGARKDLGRPKEKPFENKVAFMANLE